jgi:drug/metabolite transporter (DMT)-like permease
VTAGTTVASRRVLRIGGRAPAGIIAMVAAVLVFSCSSTLVKWADTPGSVVAFWRMLISVVLWWVVIVGRKVRTGRPAPSRRTWRLVLPAGLCFGLNITLFFTAIGRTSIAHAEFITALSPILLVPLGAILFHERPDPRALPWGAVSLLGLAIVLFLGGSQGGATVGGDLLVVVVVLFWIGYLLTGRRARATVDVVDFMATMMPLGVLTAAPVALLIAGGDIWPLSAKGWIAAGMLGVLTGMIGHGLIAYSQREVDIATIGIIQVGQPALAVGWSFLILGEQIKLAQIPGMVLVLVGLAAFTLVSQRRSPRPVPAATVDPDQHGELTGPVG